MGIIPGSGITPIAVTAGSLAWGAWTTLFTPAYPISGFMLSVGEGNGSYGVFNIGLGSGTPSVIPINLGVYDGGFTGYTTFPVTVEPGIPIQIQLWSLTSYLLSTNVTLIPVPFGVLDRCAAIQSLGSSTSSNVTTIGTTQTLFGTTLAMPAKKMIFVGGNAGSA